MRGYFKIDPNNPRPFANLGKSVTISKEELLVKLREAAKQLRLKDKYKEQHMDYINVTQEDIDSGNAGDGEYCAVALAARRCTGQKWLVGDDHMELVVGQEIVSIPLPAKAAAFVSQFDKDRTQCQPFTFCIPDVNHSFPKVDLELLEV